MRPELVKRILEPSVIKSRSVAGRPASGWSHLRQCLITALHELRTFGIGARMSDCVPFLRVLALLYPSEQAQDPCAFAKWVSSLRGLYE